MGVPSVIRQRLAELGVEQRDLATAAQAAESCISRLLKRKKKILRAGPGQYLGQDGTVLKAIVRGACKAGGFSWIGPEWEKDLRYRDDSLVTEVFLQNETLGLALQC